MMTGDRLLISYTWKPKGKQTRKRKQHFEVKQYLQHICLAFVKGVIMKGGGGGGKGGSVLRESERKKVPPPPLSSSNYACHAGK